MARMTVTYSDFTEEVSSVNFAVPEPAGALTAGEITSLVNAWGTILNNVTLGAQIRRLTTIAETTTTYVEPDSSAQREGKWLVRYRDNVNGRAGSFEIPTYDDNLLNPEAKDKMLISSGAGLALVEAIEDGPDGDGLYRVLSVSGNPVTVVDIIHVGRNT